MKASILRTAACGLQRIFFTVIWLTLLGNAVPAAAQTAVAGQLVITEFRLRGPSGANDEYIVIQNLGATAHTVVAASGTGYGVAASDGFTRFSIPNGTVIPAGGYFLGTNTVAYSLGSYPAGNGTTATGDAIFTGDIPDNAGIAIFNNNVAANYTLANRLDAVGSTAESNTLYKEGTGYPAITPFSIDYAFVRDRCGKGGSVATMGPCPSNGAVADTNNNAADFVFVDSNGTSAGAGQRLGVASPRNLSSPLIQSPTGVVGTDVLDSCAPGAASPNMERDLTSDPVNNSTFGTVDLRQRFTNNLGVDITRLRFRVIDLSTFPAPSGVADLRPRTSANISATVDRPPCGTGTSTITVSGTTLEQPPSQTNGGGFNSTMSAGAVTLGTPLANGASIDLRFLFGVQQPEKYKVRLLIEGLPEGGGGNLGTQVINFEGDTEPPKVDINQDPAQSDPTGTSPVHFKAVFSSEVTGFSGADVQLSGTAGATTAVVSGGPLVYDVAVSGMTNSGTVIASIPMGVAIDASNRGNLASSSADNTVSYNKLDNVPPSVAVEQAAGQADPTLASPINFMVTFSEPVSGFSAAGVVLSGTAGATTVVVTGGPTVYSLAVSGMTGAGSVIATVSPSAATDAAGNANLASTSVDNTVAFQIADVTPPTVTINQAASQADPATTSPIHFDVTFSEPVAGFGSAGVQLSGTAGASTAVVSGGPTVFDVAVSGMSSSGTVIAQVKAAAANDLAGNPSGASTSTDNTVTWTKPADPPTESPTEPPVVQGSQPIPMLSEWALLVLSWCVVAFAVVYLRCPRQQ